MKCERVQEMMGAYLYGDLSPEDMRDVRLHAEECSECREDLESREQAVSCLGDEVPQLSDDERLSIAWGVRGALRQQIARRPLLFRPASAFAVTAVLIAGLIVGALLSMHAMRSQAPAPTQAAKPSEPANAKTSHVIVTEVKPNRATNDSGGLASGSSPRSNRSKAIDTALRAVRRGMTLGTSSRNSDAATQKRTKPEEPVPVTGEKSESGKAQPATEGAKLPAPTDLNDAQTSTKQGTDGQ